MLLHEFYTSYNIDAYVDLSLGGNVYNGTCSYLSFI